MTTLRVTRPPRSKCFSTKWWERSGGKAVRGEAVVETVIRRPAVGIENPEDYSPINTFKINSF